METLKTPSMHCRLGGATVLQLAFPGEGNPNVRWEKSQWDFSHGKFGLLSPEKASCDRGVLPHLQCMLGVLVFL